MGVGTSLDIISNMLMAAMLVSPEGTTFYFTAKTNSPLCKFWGNKLQDCVAASPMQPLIHLYLSLLASTGTEIMYIEFRRRTVMKRKVLAKQIDSFKTKFDKN